MENLSENQPKRERGRPRGANSHYADTLRGALGAGHSDRYYVNMAFHGAAMRAVTDAGPKAQEAIWGWTPDEILRETGNFPKGWLTTAFEVGRWIKAGGDPAYAVEVLASMRQRGIAWSDIRACFRRLRLGEREGNAMSLLLALSRTIDEYRKTFPKTTDRQVIVALTDAIDAVRPEDDE